MRHIKVKDYEGLVRDTKSNAIVNTQSSEYEVYISRIQKRKEHSDQIRSVVKEVNILKQELIEIKGLIKEVLKK